MFSINVACGYGRLISHFCSWNNELIREVLFQKLFFSDAVQMRRLSDNLKNFEIYINLFQAHRKLEQNLERFRMAN